MLAKVTTSELGAIFISVCSGEVNHCALSIQDYTAAKREMAEEFWQTEGICHTQTGTGNVYFWASAFWARAPKKCVHLLTPLMDSHCQSLLFLIPGQCDLHTEDLQLKDTRKTKQTNKQKKNRTHCECQTYKTWHPPCYEI